MNRAREQAGRLPLGSRRTSVGDAKGEAARLLTRAVHGSYNPVKDMLIPMKIRPHFPILVALLCLICASRARAQIAPPSAATTVEIKQLKTTWNDSSRRREVPVKAFYPAQGGPFPLLILSHGLGGSRDGLDYLGKYWAAHGYVCAQIQHLGTDDAVWRDAPDEKAANAALSRAAGNLANILNRPRDVSFAIDQMLALSADPQSEFYGKIDPARIGVAGHSLGAFTVLASAGQKLIGSGGTLDLTDPRIRACVAMSAPLNPQAPVAEQFADFKVPCFYLVGADDHQVLGATIAHRQIYDAIGAPDQFLLIVGGADHMALGGQRFGDDLPGDAAVHALVQRATLAFWEAELKGDEAAKSWLRDGLRAQLPAGSLLESK